jgi:hypothetical protein
MSTIFVLTSPMSCGLIVSYVVHPNVQDLCASRLHDGVLAVATTALVTTLVIAPLSALLFRKYRIFTHDPLSEAHGRFHALFTLVKMWMALTYVMVKTVANDNKMDIHIVNLFAQVLMSSFNSDVETRKCCCTLLSIILVGIIQFFAKDWDPMYTGAAAILGTFFISFYFNVAMKLSVERRKC